mmetsp:Transcript_29409/g.45268  ORF Transcript_29409/g.45268 Transcript_29409/m.45268 type:complete len:210 (-) Transcript_29409:96-725(-)
MGKKGGKVRVKQMGAKAPKGLMNPMDALAIPPEEMIHLPPPPDRSYQIFWPIHETFSMDPSSFQIIYPSYMDSTKTIAEGRRIGTEKAVDTPTVSDLSQALQTMKIRHVLQPYKGYSRDITTLWDNPGRVKVEIPQDMTKRQLMIKLGEIIPTLASRLQRLEQEKQQKELEEKAKEEAALRDRQAQKQLQQQRQATATKGNKKKGKKKR